MAIKFASDSSFDAHPIIRLRVQPGSLPRPLRCALQRFGIGARLRSDARGDLGGMISNTSPGNTAGSRPGQPGA
jgi:hypothetical protein